MTLDPATTKGGRKGKVFLPARLIPKPLGGYVRNVELLEAGREIDDDTYRRRYRIDTAGVFMHDLTNAEVIANLLSNQAVALELAPTLVAAWYNHGIDLMTAGRLQEAVTSFDRSIGLYASDAQAHNNRGLAKLKLGDVEGAGADWMPALEIEPRMREAEQNLKRLTRTGGR